MINSLMQQSFNQIDQYMNKNYIDFNKYKEISTNSWPQNELDLVENGLVDKFSHYVQQQTGGSFNLKRKPPDKKTETCTENECELFDRFKIKSPTVNEANNCANGVVKHDNVEESKLVLKKRTSLLYLLRFPNMKRKFLVLIYLSMTQFSLYISYTYFILDFVDKGMLLSY